MKYIIIDFEMNNISKEYKEERKLCGREIIQIGAIALDEQYQEAGSFMTLVKPQYNDVIIHHIEKLTGITTKMVENAPNFEAALHLFFEWCCSLGDAFQIHQWSESDECQLNSEIALKKILLSDAEKNIVYGWKDFQREFGDKIGLSDPVSLKNAIMYSGVDNVGYYHDALYDARNTAKLFGIVCNPISCKKALDLVIQALNPTPVKSTLGDLFNFDSLVIAS